MLRLATGLLFVTVTLPLLAGCKDSKQADPVPAASSSAASVGAEPLRFPAQGVSYTPLSGWSDRRAERAGMFVDQDAGARWTRPVEGEVFHLDAPPASGFIAVSLLSLPTPDDADPVALLQHVVDADRAFYAKAPLRYSVIVPPRQIRNAQGIVGAEMFTRWDRMGEGKWQRTALRVFPRNGRAYLLDCGWSDRLGEMPPDLPHILDALHFD